MSRLIVNIVSFLFLLSILVTCNGHEYTDRDEVHVVRKLRPDFRVGKGNNTEIFGGGDNAVKTPIFDLLNLDMDRFQKEPDTSNGQAKWILYNIFKQMEKWDKDNSIHSSSKTFLEFGARDGVYESNTKFLEDNFGWSGLLIEAGRDYIEALREKRLCSYKDKKGACVWTALDGRSAKRYYWSPSDVVSENKPSNYPELQVKTMTLRRLLKLYKANHIDLLSADCEGCEFNALSSLDLGGLHSVDVFIIEKQKDCALYKNFFNHGYIAIPLWFTYDIVFVNPNVTHKIANAPILTKGFSNCNNHPLVEESVALEKIASLTQCDKTAKIWKNGDRWPMQ